MKKYQFWMSGIGGGVSAGVGLGCLLVAQTGFVLAATAAETPATGGALDEIVVTATRRTENIQVVPLSVDVVSQSMLQQQNLSDTTDLKRLVPALEYRHTGTPANNGFSIRGVETLGTGYGLEQSAGVAFDGVPLARNVGSTADLVDIHSVEVLLGPQGMLFGKNASAGLINIVSNSPELGKTDTSLRASFGSLNDRQYSGTVNLPVTEDSAARLTAWKFSHDGTIHEINTGQSMNDKNSDGARFKYRWKATDQLELNFTGEWVSHDENGAGYSFRSFVPANYALQAGPGDAAGWELAHGTVPSETNRTARGVDRPYFDKGNTDAYTGQADYQIGDGTLTAIVAYRNIKNNDSYDAFPSDDPYYQQYKNTDKIAYNQLSEELRYASPVAERIRYVVGLFNFRLKLNDVQGFGVSGVLPGIPVAVTLLDADFQQGLKNNNYAAFGEATFDITSKLHFIAGIRRSTDQLYVSMNRGGVYTGILGPFAASDSTEYNDISWRTGLQYEFAPDAMLYGTVSRGYKGPGNGYNLGTTQAEVTASHGDIIKPEIVHAYEIGVKSQWFDRRLTANIAVYQEYFDDFQTSVILPGPGVGVSATTNAGQLTSTGAEVNVRWLVIPSVTLIASEAYDNARFTDYKGAACYPGQTAAQGCVNGSQNATGDRVANSPKERASLTARYDHALSSKFNGYFQVNGAYRSDVNYTSYGDPFLRQGGYTVVNMAAGVDTADGHWGVSVYGNNVLDRHYVDMVTNGGTRDATLLNDIGYEDLQTFGIAVTAHF